MAEVRLILEQPCEHDYLKSHYTCDYIGYPEYDQIKHTDANCHCLGGSRSVLDSDREIHLEGATGRGFDALISDVIDALLSQAVDD